MWCAVEVGAGFIGSHPGLGIEGAAAGIEGSDDGKVGQTGLDRATGFEAGEAGGEAFGDDDFALARAEPASVGEVDLGPEVSSARGDAAEKRVGVAGTIASGGAHDEDEFGGDEGFVVFVAGDFVEELEGAKLFAGDEAAGLGLGTFTDDEDIAGIAGVGVGWLAAASEGAAEEEDADDEGVAGKGDQVRSSVSCATWQRAC